MKTSNLAKIAVFVLMLALAGCRTEETSSADMLKIVQASSDYTEYSNDFSKYGKEFEPVMKESYRLTKEIAETKIAELKNSPNRSMAVIYEGLPYDKNIYYAEFYDKEIKERGIIAIIDLGSKKTLRFYAILDVEGKFG